MAGDATEVDAAEVDAGAALQFGVGRLAVLRLPFAAQRRQIDVDACVQISISLLGDVVSSIGQRRDSCSSRITNIFDTVESQKVAPDWVSVFHRFLLCNWTRSLIGHQGLTRGTKLCGTFR